MTLIAILDYGMGNLRSVEKALVRIGARPQVTDDYHVAREADGLVLPGVGAFPKAMHHVHEQGFDELIEERLAAGVPVLGICLGMQLLFASSTENEGAEGLGLLEGSVEPLDADGLKVPHIGWSPVRLKSPSALTEGLAEEEPFYFVHSFAPRPASGDDVLATAAYGSRFVCAVERGRLFGVQFHPEKSSAAGMRLLANFASICAPATVA